MYVHPLSPASATQAGLRRRHWVAALAGLALRPRLALAGDEAAARGLNDLMPAFWTVYDASSGAAAEVRAQSLLSQFFSKYAEVYHRAGAKVSLAGVTRWLAQFDAMAAQVRQVHQQFANAYALGLQRFSAALSDFDAIASPVTVLPSLFRFDAHLQPDGAQLPLFFGPDGIVRFHGAQADLNVLFTHELFHCYQAQKNPSMSLDPVTPVFANLWIEGVATYASERLNPGASTLHVLLDDAELAGIDASTLRSAVQNLLAHWDASDDATLGAFFQTGYHGAWPARTGYYIGLMAARRIGAGMGLSQMAAMPTPEVRTRLMQAVRDVVPA